MRKYPNMQHIANKISDRFKFPSNCVYEEVSSFFLAEYKLMTAIPLRLNYLAKLQLA